MQTSRLSSCADEAWIDDLLGRMSLRQKIGQCFTVGFMDTFPRPDVLIAIRELHCGGLRLVPWERQGSSYEKGEDRCFKGGAIHKDSGRRSGAAAYATPTQYAQLLNHLQEIALERPAGLPLHFSIDQEGDSYNDYTRGGVNLFPSNMGLAATGDEGLTYRAFLAIGLQLRALGVTFVHSPVLDVNVNPANPEINFRSFGDDPQVVARMGVQALRGLTDGGVVAVAKHFPGRGNSHEDSHYDFNIYPHDARQMHEIDLLPYRTLIASGLQSIMTAHTVYPGLGDAQSPASVSPTIVRGLLRKTMGFSGVITTDSITMLGLMTKYGLADACRLALEAGNDLILYRGPVRQLPEVFYYIERRVAEGLFDVDILDGAIRRVLRLKKRQGLFDNPLINLSTVEAPLRDAAIVELSRSLPAKTASWVKQGRWSQLSPRTHVLLAEQAGRYAWQCNDMWYHPGMMYERMLQLADAGSVEVVECTISGRDDLPRIQERISQADVVVITSFYCRTSAHNMELVRKVQALGKPVVAVTNNPYVCENLMGCDSVLWIGSGNPCGLKACADILYGRTVPAGHWPLKIFPQPQEV